jgi:hypothetical protein
MMLPTQSSRFVVEMSKSLSSLLSEELLRRLKMKSCFHLRRVRPVQKSGVGSEGVGCSMERKVVDRKSSREQIN